MLSFRYERDDLEALSPAQKQLLRMGPRNVRIVQDQLRAVARELGIPLTRLPRARRPAVSVMPGGGVACCPGEESYEVTGPVTR